MPVVVDQASSSEQLLQRSVFTDSLEQGMSRGFVVTALDIEGVQPWLEDQGFEEIYERLVGGELSG